MSPFQLLRAVAYGFQEVFIFVAQITGWVLGLIAMIVGLSFLGNLVSSAFGI